MRSPASASATAPTDPPSATPPAASAWATTSADPASVTAPADPTSATAPAASASVTAPADHVSANSSAPIGVPASSGDFTSPPAPTLHVAIPEVDVDAVRSALSVLSALPNRLAAQNHLDGEHDQLQRAFRRQADKIARLKRESAASYAAASPYVQYAQRQYDLLHHRYLEATQRSAEFHSALIDRQADAQDIVNLRARLKTIRDRHAEEVTQLHAAQEDLAQQLATAQQLSQGPTPRLG
jgi:hypothetical protein